MKKKKNKLNNILPTVGGLTVLGAVVAMTVLSSVPAAPATAHQNADIPHGGELMIDKHEVTHTASFHPYDSNGTYMEVIAVLDSDGEVRTSFNTCQVCYSSGRGYYEQLGDQLICNNCGNRFTIDQIGYIKGGCNPVPITDSQKKETEDTVTITAKVMDEYAPMFANWRK